MRVSGEPGAWLAPDRPVVLVLDQRRATEACRELLGHEGIYEHVPLFAATPLSPLQEAGPWCLLIQADSDAWRVGEALCRERRLGWCCQPSPTVTFPDLVEHLRGLFVWADPQGGQSLLNLQDPAALTALLGSAEWRLLRQWLAPLGSISTPTPQGHWQTWQYMAPQETTETAARLSTEVQRALKSAPRAWFLAERLGTRLDQVDAAWLEGLVVLNRHGITLARHLESLLPLVQQAAWRESDASRAILETDQPAWQKVKALRELMGKLQAQEIGTRSDERYDHG